MAAGAVAAGAAAAGAAAAGTVAAGTAAAGNAEAALVLVRVLDDDAETMLSADRGGREALALLAPLPCHGSQHKNTPLSILASGVRV